MTATTRGGVGRGGNADKVAESLGRAAGGPPWRGRVGASWSLCCVRQLVKAMWTPWQGFRRTKLEASGASE